MLLNHPDGQYQVFVTNVDWGVLTNYRSFDVRCNKTPTASMSYKEHIASVFILDDEVNIVPLENDICGRLTAYALVKEHIEELRKGI